MGLIFRIKCGRAMTQTAGYLLFQELLPECNEHFGSN